MTSSNLPFSADPLLGIANLSNTALPLNRKERYFTGTVLPMLVCAHEFAHFSRLTVLAGLGEVHVDARPLQTNVQFFTEYGFAESIVGDAKSHFSDAPTTRDTPDVLIYIAGPRAMLLAIEAKMYDNPYKAELEEQLRAQDVILRYLQRKLGIATNHVAHVALLPQKLATKIGELSVRTITWEQVLEAYSDVAPAYFVETLRLALERYEQLASRILYGANAQFKLCGEIIVDKYRAGELENSWMGRRNGLIGDELQNDINTGTWRTFMYECSSIPVDNRNWFRVKEFVERFQLDKS